MGKKVIWTPRAILTFNKVIEYLEAKWTEKEITKFIEATERVVIYIAERPEMFRRTDIEGVHEALVTTHNLLIYKIYSDRIDLIAFWDTRQNPENKSYPG